MITIPSILLHSDVAVYPDDEDCNLYYCIKTTPEIRIIDDQPVFSGLFWTDKADGSSKSVAGLAGGWINFDSHLGVSQKVEDEIRDKIKSLGIQKTRRNEQLKTERERLAMKAKASGTEVPEPEVPSIGDIRFGAINFTEGTVTLLEESGGDLIPWSSAGGPASLSGNNNAAFALRLSPEGAAIWYKALKEEIKAISIRYELKFSLRLPSLEIRAWAGSNQYSKYEKALEVIKGGKCKPDKTVVREITRKFEEYGLVNIEIKKGSTEISDEYVSRLRDLMMKMIEDKAMEIVKTRIEGMTEEERKNNTLKVIEEELNSFVELRFSQSDVVEWSVSPQGTIMNFLSDIPEDKKKHVTKLVDLSEHEVETVEIDIHVDAPWEEEPFVNLIKVDMTYPSAKQSNSVAFKKETPMEKWFFRRPKNDDGIVKYTTSIYFKGISEPLVLPEKISNGHLNINVGKVGLMDINFKPHPLLASLSGKNKINAIQIDLSYKNEEDKDHFKDRLILTTEDIEGKKFKKIIGKIIDAPLTYKVSYIPKDGRIIEMEEKKYYITENDAVNIYTPYPYEDSLELNVELPLVPDESVNKITIEFKYEDEKNNFESADQVILYKDDSWEPAMAKLVLLDKNISQFKYRYRIISKDDIAQSGWITGNGDAEIVIPPIMKVIINTSQLGVGTDYSSGLLSLCYKDGDTKDEKEIYLTAQNASDTLSWYIPRSSDTDAEYTYSLVLFDNDGNTIESTGVGKGKILLIQKPK